jgi:hypothetical protein
VEADARLEVEAIISSGSRNLIKSSNTSHTDILHECIHASKDSMLQDKFNDATILVGSFGYTLDELEQNGHSQIKRRYGFPGFQLL